MAWMFSLIYLAFLEMTERSRNDPFPPCTTELPKKKCQDRIGANPLRSCKKQNLSLSTPSYRPIDIGFMQSTQ